MFQELMKEAPAVTNVVEACGKENRQLRLDALLEQLEMCEKALQDYLETKRMAFPRFYFVAPADLLDILSKGSDPQAILRCCRGHLILSCSICIFGNEASIVQIKSPGLSIWHAQVQAPAEEF